MIAVAEDDVDKFQALAQKQGDEYILRQRFDHGMNILNFAIDQESRSIV